MATTVTALTASALLLFAGPAFADSACNASFCNTTDGSGGRVDQVLAQKVGKLQNVIGFFEARGPRGMVATGPTTSANHTYFTRSSFRNPTTLKNGELMCLTFFAKTSGGGFVEVGTAQCTTAPF
jgi:hypothetical protein